MKSFIRLLIAVAAVLSAAFMGANLIINNSNEGGSGRPYRVEADRIALKIEKGEDYSLSDYSTITAVEKQTDAFKSGNSDYLVKEINGELYRFDYEYNHKSGNTAMLFNICFGVAAAVIFGVLFWIYFVIIRPFNKISGYPAELAKGNLTIPLRQSKGRYFSKFLWGLDLLREKLEKQKADELALQKQNKTMVLSLSHDIKTPLGVIELYAKALEKGLYKDEDKKRETAVAINSKCEDIRKYVDEISKTAREDFMDLQVNNGEFYLSKLIADVKRFYTDKLDLLKTDFYIQSYSDCLLAGDRERAVEVLQNIIENAIKYGDGKTIALSFEKEDGCLLVHVINSGCTLNESDLPHIFESFWRGSNVGGNSGSGLGLYICRTLMHKMNGEIYAEIEDDNITVTAVFFFF